MRLIYLSPTPWHSFSQRPHELVRCFHEKHQQPVLWIDPYPTRLPALSDLRRPQPAPGHTEIPPWLTVYRALALPIEPIAGSGWVNRLLWQPLFTRVRQLALQPTMLGIGKPSCLASMLLREPLFEASFYDAMDNFCEFYTGLSRRAMARRQRTTAQTVSTVLTSSSALHAQLSTYCDRVTLLGNACATERLPYRITRHAGNANPLVVGYVGTIAKWFAWEIVVALAEAFPLAQIRLVGPIHTRPPGDLPSNIQLIGELSHPDAMAAMAGFDIGLIPFKCDALTQFVDPIKYYEYRALGLPVISTVFGEMAHRGACPGTFLLDGPEGVGAAMEKALRFNPSDEQTRSFRRDNSWTVRFSTAIP
ncbi:glycosyl transferase [Pseudomonas sp. CYM-20-01]|nr:glycosyl transferase [Pseudomonas sp. CYM-20-01]